MTALTEVFFQFKDSRKAIMNSKAKLAIASLNRRFMHF